MVLITAQLGVARPDWGQRKVRNITPGTHFYLGKLGWRHVLPMWRCYLGLEVSSSIPAGSTIIYRFLCGSICVSLCHSVKIKPTNMCAHHRDGYRVQVFDLILGSLVGLWAGIQFAGDSVPEMPASNPVLTRGRQNVEIDTCAFQTGCQLSSAASDMSLFFLHNFSGVKRSCWTTGSWRSCLSLEVVSSIPAGSTIIYRFLCGFICVSLCQSIKIKPTNMCICMCVCMCVCWHLCIPDWLSVVQCSLGHLIGIVFFDTISVAWSDRAHCWTTGSWRSCLSLEVVSSIAAGSTIIYRFLCGFICVSLCQSIKIKPTNMYIASARAQFKINTHRCWNWHLCIPDGLSVVQCSFGHVIGIAFF